MPTTVERRRTVNAAFDAVVLAVATAILVGYGGQLARAVPGDPVLWVMVLLAVLSGTVAFVAAVGSEGIPAVVSPTVCFGFAILLVWGLGPAVVAQAVAVVMVAWRLRRPVLDAARAIARYTLALAASSSVLWLGNPDPFDEDGPTNILVDAISVVGAATAWLVTYALLFLGTRLATGRSLRLAVAIVRDQVLYKAALLVLSPVLALAALINVVLLPLVLIPLYAVQRMARLSVERDQAARVDPLTGLANRTGLKSAYERLRYEDTPATLLMLDLDRFKQVNDALGHDVGDRLLVAVAERLPAVPAERGVVARLGGDEFAVLTTGDDPRRLADRVAAGVGRPVWLDALRVDVTASVGVATATADEEFTLLMRRADVAMYDAKQRGGRVADYDPRVDRGSPDQLALLADFRQALESADDQVSVHYQPQVALGSGAVEGVEALLRWRHPRLGMVSPRDILALVEHTPVMVMLTARVIETVAAQLAAWAAAGITLRASVNVSARDLFSDDVIVHLREALRRWELPADRLQVEITESALLADLRRAEEPLRRIAALGVGISLDDFGTGYSSLQHLRRLPIDEIKIDRTFVSGMPESRDDAAIVRSTINLARSLHLRTVAEGVETDLVDRLVRDAGCTLSQGWHTARAMPADALTAWLAAAR